MASVRLISAFVLILILATSVSAAALDQITFASPVALPAAWFDPGEATGILIPFMVYYALHDALVKPVRGCDFTTAIRSPRRT